MEKSGMQTFFTLIALLLASVLLLPPVIADEQAGSGFDLDNYVIPELKFNESMETIAISGELSPQNESGNTAKGTYGIPSGSIVVHSADGITRVFDRDGNQILSISDEQSEKIPTPAGVEKPCSKVFQLPNDSIAYYRGEDEIFVLSQEGDLILTIIDDSEGENEGDSENGNDDAMNVSGSGTPAEPAPLSLVPLFAALIIFGLLWRR